MTIGFRRLVAPAARNIGIIEPAEAHSLLGSDHILCVDVQDVRDVRREVRFGGDCSAWTEVGLPTEMQERQSGA